MPYYRLWQEEGDVTHGPIQAANDEAAVARFSADLNIPLTLEEDDAVVAPFMMGRQVPEHDEPIWRKRPNIPVWRGKSN